MFHVNLLKAWNPWEEPARYGAEADWLEEGEWCSYELAEQLQEGERISTWQTQQIHQVLDEILDVFSDTPGMVQGVVHHIHTLLEW